MRFLLITLLSLTAFVAGANQLEGAETPTQQQLQTLLSGNTLNGKWDGRPFTQYFSSQGTTQYREGDGQTTHGTWRVTAEGQYCSIWPPFPRETCYEVVVKGKTILWSWDGKIHPSEVSEGNSF
ncbi:MAG: hypothetical protein AAF353_02010 [Pseudomonadota bacterium]